MTAELDKARRVVDDAISNIVGIIARLDVMRGELVDALDTISNAVHPELATVDLDNPGPRGQEASRPATTLPGRVGAEVTELRPPDGRRIIIRVGDTYAVKPSRPKKRDGWVGVIRSLTAAGEVTITAPGQCPRTITVDRLGARKAVGR